MSIDAGHGARPEPTGKALATLSIAALGVVFGDIGTSPLYAIKECFSGTHAVTLTPENVIGVLSLIFWSLNFLITFKYLAFMMKADNRGEGGILALLALVKPGEIKTTAKWVLVSVGIFGATMLYGDGIITPAISVLGAVDGIAVATPALQPYIVWISLVIIVLLFAVQSRGTGTVGAIFGPVTSVWFVCIAILGVKGILLEPGVLKAINPWYAVDFFMREGLHGFLVLAAVVLVVTGGEALYADMGHFGKRPIRVAWLAVVLPALLLNYFGQGALLLARPEAIVNPFYELVPRWGLYPMVVVATAAAVTASQALISGAFSLTQQALQLGYSPRLQIVHTSRSAVGQIYIPEVNWALMIACVLLVLAFQTPGNLAGAYGVAVTITMATTTILFTVVARERFGWGLFKALAFGGVLLAVDLAFMIANLTKIPHGGYLPLAIGGVLFVLMTTWRKGRQIVSSQLQSGALPLELVIEDVERRDLHRVPGTAVFMTPDPVGAPPVLLHHLKHNKVLHERVVMMSLVNHLVPQVPKDEKVEVTPRSGGFYTVVGHYGFMETPDVPSLIARVAEMGLVLKMPETTFYLGRETIIPVQRPGSLGQWLRRRMPIWRKRLYIVMANNARPANAFFNLPPNRVVEMGAQIQI
ncbi:MAG: potassium transporter Kup [Gemmatimonadales bacterium]